MIHHVCTSFEPASEPENGGYRDTYGRLQTTSPLAGAKTPAGTPSAVPFGTRTLAPRLQWLRSAYRPHFAERYSTGFSIAAVSAQRASEAYLHSGAQAHCLAV